MKRLISLLLCALLLTGCTAPREPEKKQYTATFLTLFDTVTTVVGKAESEEAFKAKAQTVHDGLEKYHQLFDIYHDYEGINNIKTINDQDSTLFAPLNAETIESIKTYVTKQSRYAGRVKYVDCSDVGGHGFGNAYSAQFLLDFVVHVHPDAAGHQRIIKHVSAAFNKA